VGKLRPEATCFLLCDIQERFRPLAYKMETVINTSRYMTSVANALDIPIVITQQYTKVFGDTVKDCFADPEQDMKNIPIFEKKNFSMCTKEVSEHMQELKKESIVLFGIEAHVCVQQTALDLLEQGKDVHIIVDGVTSQQALDREIALQRMSQAGAFLTTAQSAAFMLMQSAEHPNFKAVSKLTVEHMKLPNEFNQIAMGKL
jgi:nicotinamidase-related amidase